MRENVFGIQRPEMIDCTVMTYHWGRSLLTIRLKRQNSPEVQYLKFGGVLYFAAPTEWNGARFDLCDASDCLDILIQMGKVPEFTTAEHLKERNINLYRVDIAFAPVTVIAHKASKYNG